MRISPIYVNYQNRHLRKQVFIGEPENQPSFQAKWKGKLVGAGVFGTLGGIAAIGGSIIMTGGITAIPLLATYAATAAAQGAILGHGYDRYSEKLEKNKKK